MNTFLIYLTFYNSLSLSFSLWLSVSLSLSIMSLTYVQKIVRQDPCNRLKVLPRVISQLNEGIPDLKTRMLDFVFS